MARWLAGIVATLLGGSVLWFLTNGVFPNVLHDPPRPQPPSVGVECTPSPSTIHAGGSTELTIRVTYNDRPVEGAALRISWESPPVEAYTLSDGIYRLTWTAPNPSAAGYVFPVTASVDGVRTASAILAGQASTNCQILVN
jgi:hypothetical protein